MDRTINQQISEKLVQMGDVLEQQGANPFRVNAYRRAADTVLPLDRSLEAIVRDEGMKGLTALPHIGEGIARAIHEMVITGRWAQLERLRGELQPERLFQTVPGIGPKLARRIHDALSIDSLEDLELAAHDGRLKEVPGVGLRRESAIRAAVAEILNRRLKGYRERPREEPPVNLILEVDEEYREKAKAGRLSTIAPRRFNPTHEAWLPMLHGQRGNWEFTALYSNTARAHELERTRDWVVIYFYDAHHREGQRTVVTETRGPLAGRRVVRGRERECETHYYGAKDDLSP